MLKLTQLIGFGGGGYRANAVDFDGSTDYLTRASALSGAGTSSQFIFAAAFRLDGGDGGTMKLFGTFAPLAADGDISITRSSGNKIDVYITGSNAAPDRLRSVSGGSFTASASWHSLLVSADTNASAGGRTLHVYADDADAKSITEDSGGAFSMAYGNHDSISVARNFGGGSYFDGAISEMYFAPGQYIDFSIEANRRKFFDSAGRPAFKGSDGSTPTGAPPRVYLPNPAATVNVNAGAGGNFTVNGSPVDASTSPSD
jgi:hypothetical protein